LFSGSGGTTIRQIPQPCSAALGEEQIDMPKRLCDAVLLPAAIVAALAVIALWPLSIVTYPPLQDLPNHLARIDILTSSPGDVVQKYYRPSWSIIPNLGMDVVLISLRNIMPLAQASKVIVSMAIVMWLASPFALHAAAYKKFSIVPIIASLAAYNMTFEMGFLSFYLGSGLFVFGFSVWIWMEAKPLLFRISVGLLTSYILFFTHLFAFATFVLCVLIWELGTVRNSIFSRETIHRETILLGSTFGPPAATFVFLSPHAGGPLFDGLLSLWINGLGHGLLVKIRWFEMLLPAGWSGAPYAAALVCALAVAAIYYRPPGMDGRLLACCLAMALLLLTLPPFLAGGANVDWRMIAPLALFFSGSIRLTLSRTPSAIAGLAVAALVGWQSISMSEGWKKGESDFVNFSSLLSGIPAGSRLYYSTVGMSYTRAQSPPSILSEGSYALIEKCIIVPSLFAYRSQQPLAVDPAYLDIHEKLKETVNPDIDGIDWPLVERNSDFVILASDAEITGDRPALRSLKRVAQFSLYEVSHPTNAPQASLGDRSAPESKTGCWEDVVGSRPLQ
jgi:hypothetical protein